MKTHAILSQIRIELQNQATETVKLSSQRFFKEDQNLKIYGVKSAEVKEIAKPFKSQIKSLPKQEMMDLCEELFKSNYLEEAGIACIYAESIGKKYEPSDFKTFERWIDSYIENWAICDTFCNKTVGNFLMKFPAFLPELKNWTHSKNRWMKRAAAVSLIVPARKGLFLNEIFEIADALVSDTDDMVQKGYGWLLKTASETYEKEVFDYVISKKDSMPRTAYRYAIEKFSKDLKTKAMEK